MRNQRRYEFVDAIRGIAACSVMLQHSLYASGLLDLQSGFVPNRIEFGEVGVVAFFLVSGFVIPLSLERTSSFFMFWVHRAFRIYPLYFFIYAVSLVSFHSDLFLHLNSLFTNILSHATFTQEYFHQINFVGGSWTLSLELMWYMLAAAIYASKKQDRLFSIAAVVVAVSVLCIAICVYGYHLPLGRLSMLIACVVGLTCHKHKTHVIDNKRFMLITSTLLTIIGMNLFIGFYAFPGSYPTAKFGSVCLSWAVGFMLFFVFFVFEGLSSLCNSLLIRLGRISFSIYLNHALVIAFLTHLGLGGTALVVLVGLLTVSVSTLTFVYIEAPGVRMSHLYNKRRHSSLIQSDVQRGREMRDVAIHIPDGSGDRGGHHT